MPDELLLSVDFEDWHQLVRRRRVGAANWREPGGERHSRDAVRR